MANPDYTEINSLHSVVHELASLLLSGDAALS